MRLEEKTTATLLTILFLASISIAPVLPVVAAPVELAYDDGTCDGNHPEVHVNQYLRQKFLVSDFGLSEDCLVEIVRICWGPYLLPQDFVGVIKLRDHDTGYVVTAASFSYFDIISGWQDYDVSGSDFVSDHFYVELWQTSGFGYICSDDEGTLHYMGETSKDGGVTWSMWASMNFMIRASVTPATIPATVDINPETLNLKSNGPWITAHIGLPEGSVSDIEIASIVLTTEVGGMFLVVDAPTTIDTTLIVKFNRTALVDYLGNEDLDSGEGLKFYDVTLMVTGTLTDGTPFLGSTTTKVIKKG